MKTQAFVILLPLLFTLSLWSATPVPYSGKIDIRELITLERLNSHFLCTMGMVQLIGEMVINQEKPLRSQFVMAGIMFS